MEKIKLGSRFTAKGIVYTCVGYDHGMVWGVIDSFSESVGFDSDNCESITKALGE